MGAEKVTTMVLKVDLQCSSCYKKTKRTLCKFPQIRDQIYNDKANTVTVTVTVVCCSPEKIRDKLCCMGGKAIKSIEILEPKPTEKPIPDGGPPPPPDKPTDDPKPGPEPVQLPKSPEPVPAHEVPYVGPSYDGYRPGPYYHGYPVPPPQPCYGYYGHDQYGWYGYGYGYGHGYGYGYGYGGRVAQEEPGCSIM